MHWSSSELRHTPRRPGAKSPAPGHLVPRRKRIVLALARQDDLQLPLPHESSSGGTTELASRPLGLSCRSVSLQLLTLGSSGPGLTGPVPPGCHHQARFLPVATGGSRTRIALTSQIWLCNWASAALSSL